DDGVLDAMVVIAAGEADQRPAVEVQGPGAVAEGRGGIDAQSAGADEGVAAVSADALELNRSRPELGERPGAGDDAGVDEAVVGRRVGQLDLPPAGAELDAAVGDGEAAAAGADARAAEGSAAGELDVVGDDIAGRFAQRVGLAGGAVDLAREFQHARAA